MAAVVGPHLEESTVGRRGPGRHFGRPRGPGAVALSRAISKDDPEQGRRAIHMTQIADFDEVMAEARRGDHDALATLYREFHPQVLRYLKGTLRDDVEDVAAEVWIHVATGIVGFQGDETAFRKWLFTIAVRRRIDAQRRQSNRPVPLGDALPDSAVGARDVTLTLYATELLSQLPVELAEILLLRVVAGFDAATVGDLVGKSAGAVRVAAHRALERLRAIADVAAIEHAVDRVASTAQAPTLPAEPLPS